MNRMAAAGLVLAFALGTSGLFGLTADAKNDGGIRYNKETNTPSVITEKWRAPRTFQSSEVVWSYLEAKQDLFKLKGDVKSQFKILKKEKDSLGMTHYRLQEVYKGIPVYGSQQTIHVDQNGDVTSYFGQVIPGLEAKNIPTRANIDNTGAVQAVKNDLKASQFAADPRAELMIYPHEGKYHLAYYVTASVIYPQPGYWHYFVDAVNAKVIDKWNAAEATGSGTGVLGDTKTFETTYSGGTYYLWGQSRGEGIKTHHAKNASYTSPKLPGTLISSTTNTFTDGAAVDAHAYAEKVYDYYKLVHGRNSYDGNGAAIVSSVHVGRSWNNAAWIGTQMVYGDGDGMTFRPLSGDLDVVAHELTHAVTDTTADLIYQNESGALNESMSDIFAAMVDSDNWLIGEDVYTPNIPGDALRSMSDPAAYGDPDHYSKRYTGNEDNGGVHINSGINNKACYLIAQGGTHYGVTVTGIGRDKTAKIYYRALTVYLHPSSTFADMRQAAVQAATDLYGASSPEVQAVKNAYTAVGVN
ncbi:M4 family metallopeptidase [Lihuaxuella thermophila]|uniref:Neutral metalloproteinase n=1 Tax=Lihuaxuella thermophila TaxID=1173111 RepID=A0A1H8BFQ4_9BACL|nr:M4 family metallopeptidase [Lihuaxuella thermophila]SEM81663.1 thermolysin [Lihuaxuella thermophila]